jgi:hypothetical protein
LAFLPSHWEHLKIPMVGHIHFLNVLHALPVYTPDSRRDFIFTLGNGRGNEVGVLVFHWDTSKTHLCLERYILFPHCQHLDQTPDMKNFIETSLDELHQWFVSARILPPSIKFYHFGRIEAVAHLFVPDRWFKSGPSELTHTNDDQPLAVAQPHGAASHRQIRVAVIRLCWQLALYLP